MSDLGLEKEVSYVERRNIIFGGFINHGSVSHMLSVMGLAGVPDSAYECVDAGSTNGDIVFTLRGNYTLVVVDGSLLSGNYVVLRKSEEESLVELRIPMNHYLVCVDPERPVESDNILMVLSRDVWFDLVLRRKVGNPYLPFNW